MTVRAVILGLIGALALAAVAYLNDQVVALEIITAGSLLPISVFSLLFILVIGINPLLYLLGAKRRLRPGELAVIVLLILVACSVSSRGMLDTFTPAIMMPLYYHNDRPGWQDRELLGYAPRRMIPCDGQYDKGAMADFIEGRGRPGRPIGLGQVPWAEWSGPLSVWMPMAVLMAVAATCTAVIVHRQWSRREHLRYPIGEMASALMAQEPHSPAGPLFRNRLFWLGLAIVLSVRVINGLATWYPVVPQIPMMVNFTAIREQTRGLWATQFGDYLLYPRLFPTIVAFSFFLSSEIAFSLGISQWLMVPIGSLLIAHGVDLSTGYMSGGARGYQRFGSYLAFALIILYMGRRHYWLVLRGALTFRRHGEVPGYAAWACRIGLAAAAGAVAILIGQGLDWPMAIMTIGLMLMTFLCVARITAETGMFIIDPRWQAMGVLWGFFGSMAIGPEAIVAVGLACAVLSLGPGQSLMPYLINAMKICDDQGVRPHRIAPAVVGTFALCLLVAVPVILWANYNFGVREDNFHTVRVPTMPFRAAASAVDELTAWGDLEKSKKLGPLERFAYIRPRTHFLWAAGAGFLLVLVVAGLRQRLPRWPLHPVMFLVWGTYPSACFNHSFLLGWLIRAALLRFAGHSAVRKARPFMIGVIVGDLLGGAVFMAAGAARYALSGYPPPAVKIFP